LGLCPRPHWGAHSALPDPIAAFKGKGGRKGRGKGEEGKHRGEREERKRGMKG